MDEYQYDDLKTNPKSMGLCIITHPFPSEIVGQTLLSNFIKVLESLSNVIFVITGISLDDIFYENVRIISVKSDRQPLLISSLKFILAQLKISANLIKISKRIEVVIFFVGGTSLVFPLLSAFLLRKNIITVVTASDSKKTGYSETLYGLSKKFFSIILKVLEKANYMLSNQIVLYSESLVNQLGLEKYKNKISTSGARFVDANLFKVKKNLDERAILVGYIGRLSEEKGVMNFVDAIPLILKEHNDVKFVIGGDGLLLNKIKEKLKKSELYDKVTITGWIPHDDLADYLNELKLLIIPSYTETGPQIALEAMACGTPILATPVGLIPHIVKDCETGFILEDNSPETIAESIANALNHPKLSDITKNAEEIIKEEYTYEKAVERYRRIIYEMVR